MDRDLILIVGHEDQGRLTQTIVFGPFSFEEVDDALMYKYWRYAQDKFGEHGERYVERINPPLS